MKYLVATAVLLSGLVLPSSLAAQFRAAARPSEPAHRFVAPSFTRVRPAPAPVRGSFVGPAPMGGWRHGSGGAGQHHHHGTAGLPVINFGGGFTGSTCLADPTAAGAVFCRNSIPQQTSFGVPLFGVPYYWSVPMVYEPPAEEEPPAASESDNALAAQVAMLTDAVRQLREDQALRATAQPPAVSPPARAEEKATPVVLIYRDGRRIEVENYAVLGQTLWVFRKQATRRIPLADLDLDATRKANEERGIDFLAADSQ